MTRQFTLDELIRSSNFIDGKWTEAADGARFAVTDPATGKTITDVADSGPADAHAATDAAARAFPAWRDRLPGERATILRRWHALILANQDTLGALISLEQGKPLAEGKGEVRQAHDRDQGAGGSRRCNHAVEFPARDDCPQDRTRVGRGLHGDRQTRRGHAAHRAGADAARA
jgi:acyl-CoA reductase-like NAD-dependent aldehyde dehydrogenase